MTGMSVHFLERIFCYFILGFEKTSASELRINPLLCYKLNQCYTMLYSVSVMSSLVRTDKAKIDVEAEAFGSAAAVHVK